MPARPPKADAVGPRLIVTQTRSAIGSKPKHRGTIAQKSGACWLVSPI
jgi:hypothetical protein